MGAFGINVFDDVQNRLRELGSLSEEAGEQGYVIRRAEHIADLQHAERWVVSGKGREYLQQHYRGKCVLVLWERVVGHGDNLEEANRVAMEVNHIDPRATYPEYIEGVVLSIVFQL